MNKFQLALIGTESLKELQAAVKEELSQRRRLGYVEARRTFAGSLRPQQFESHGDIDDFNSSLCLRPPTFLRSHIGGVMSNLSRYATALDRQDWRSVYPGQDTPGDCYVYAHVDPRSACFVAPVNLGASWGGLPFYIGKGVGARAYDLKRNQAHGKRIAAILEDGFAPSDIVRVVRGNLSDNAALCLEAKLVFFFGTEYEELRGPLVNLDIPKTPPCDGRMRRYPSKTHWAKKWGQESSEITDSARLKHAESGRTL